MCEKRQNVSERLKKENLHSGQEDAPLVVDPPTMPEGVRGVKPGYAAVMIVPLAA